MRELGESHAVVVLVFFPFFVNFSSVITKKLALSAVCHLRRFLDETYYVTRGFGIGDCSRFNCVLQSSFMVIILSRLQIQTLALALGESHIHLLWV